MTNLIITIDSAQVDALLAQLVHRSDHLDPVLTAIGHTVNQLIRSTFVDLKTPEGSPWKQLSPVTISRRTNHSHVPLMDTGMLSDSIAYQMTGAAVEIGTNAKQAAMMNFGGTKAQFGHLWGDIPARQFMPTEHLPVTWEQDVIEVIEDYLGIL
ncbi:MAG: phage virion morphogenesis protein [Methylococcales bacterium]|nr:phage virion morphogenesis protein [Methylococcales bacterium]